jgi:hypothetical protein
MNPRYRSYTACSIGVGVVWAVLLVLASIFDTGSRRTNIDLVFLGFAIGVAVGDNRSVRLSAYEEVPARRANTLRVSTTCGPLA